MKGQNEMNVPVIEMDVDEAKEKLEAYRYQLTKRADAEYEAAAAGYKALADGKRLINLTEAIQAGGLGADGRPKLAVARAHRQEVCVVVSDGRVRFQYGRARGFRQIQVDMQGASWRTATGYALVPMVPADVRPHVDMSKCHILWEVIAWADVPKLVRPDRDPYLLRHIAGDLYAVLAEWDLTELERAVMSQRRPA